MDVTGGPATGLSSSLVEERAGDLSPPAPRWATESRDDLGRRRERTPALGLLFSSLGRLCRDASARSVVHAPTYRVQDDLDAHCRQTEPGPQPRDRVITRQRGGDDLAEDESVLGAKEGDGQQTCDARHVVVTVGWSLTRGRSFRADGATVNWTDGAGRTLAVGVDLLTVLTPRFRPLQRRGRG